MIRIFKCHRLVTGVVSGPKPEIVAGRSTFYPDALDQLSSPIQETSSQDVLNSLEQSKASVTSEDVAQASESKFKGKTTLPSTQICKPYAQSKHKAICAKASYVPVKHKSIKILVVGAKGAGKTSIIQYTTSDQESNPFCCQYKTTSLPSCSGKLVEHYGELYIINFWELIDDTHSCEEQHHEYYTGAMGAFVVCESSKINVSSILLYKKKINNIVCQRNGNPIPVYLLVSKCDIKHEARGSQNDSAMAKLVEENGFAGYFKTSAKTGKGIEEAVRAAQKEILRDTFPHPPRVCETPDDLKK